MPVAQLATLTPAISWSQFFEHTGAPPITDLNVANPDFFKGLNSLLASTDLDTVKTYLRWQLVNSLPDITLPEKMDAESFDFYGRKLRGQPEQEARWKRCVNATDGALGEAVGKVYVEKEFPPSSKAATMQMVDDIEGAMDKDYRHSRLDGRRHQGQSQREAASGRRQNRLSRPLARLLFAHPSPVAMPSATSCGCRI